MIFDSKLLISFLMAVLYPSCRYKKYCEPLTSFGYNPLPLASPHHLPSSLTASAMYWFPHCHRKVKCRV